MTPTSPTVLSMLHGRASLRPNDTAFTFTDYEDNPAGVRTDLTWSQLSRRTSNMAHQALRHGSVGDRAVILAPQNLHYATAFLGAMQAGLIAVPLPLPHRGSADERVGAVLADTTPTVVLTTSAAAEDVTRYVDQAGMATSPKIVEVDSLNLDGESEPGVRPSDAPDIAYLQYSSGSTRVPTGVIMTHRNLSVNFEQLMRGFFAGFKVPADGTIVSWLPFYHDMGLVLGVCAPILGGYHAELMSPLAFLEQPARWMRALAENPHAWSSAPNFAFHLAARRTTDRDLDGLDLGEVVGIISGAERVDPATVQRFVDRFSHFHFRDDMIRPSYGLAEATVFVAAGTWNESSGAVRFDAEELSEGRVRRSGETGTALVRYQLPDSPTVRIVDGEGRECPPDVVGEIWVHGDNVASGYWHKSADEQRCFGATLADPSPGTPDGPWLKTGDLGFVSEGELFIVGRIKDLLIVCGRNHYPEDIESTVQEVTHGRVAAISVPMDGTEQLVAIAEVKVRGESDEDKRAFFTGIRTDVTSAVANVHGLNVADLVLVSPGAIPITTSGKIRRATCVEQYRRGELTSLDA